MHEFLNLLQSNYFFHMALLASIAASIASGIVGSYVVAQRISFLSGSISHSVLGGIGLFLYLSKTFNLPSFTPLLGALCAGLISSIIMGIVYQRKSARQDTLIAAMWSFGMSLGVILMTLTPGYNVDLMNYLFGNILWTTSSDLYLLITLDAVICGTVLLLHRRFLAISFDSTQATLSGQKSSLLSFILLFLVAATVVILIQVIGSILIVAMLCLPAAIAMQLAKRLHHVIFLSMFICIICCIFGLIISFALNFPPGATIAFCLTVFYLGFLPFQKS